MTRTFLPRRLFTLTVAALLAIPTTGQISYGGEPNLQGLRPEARTFPALDLVALEAEDRVTDVFKEAPWRFGVEHDVLIDCHRDGVWMEEGQDLVWRYTVRAEAATCGSFRFSQYRIPKGGKLFMYSADGLHVLGAFDHRNEKDWGGLATGIIPGSDWVVEYRQNKHLADAPELVIDQIVQGYRSLNGWSEDRGPFGNSGACNINVNCPEGATWATEKRSVALIVQGGFAVCSGGLVNNTLNDGTPYFLTANHCLGNPGNWVYYFNHESPSCNSNNGPTNQSISGGTLLVNSGQSDVALIELSQTPPANFNVQYAGWDATGAIPSSAVGIHHPSGDVKKICFEDDSPSQQNQGGAAVWYINQWELGVTEGGSSGSPLFDQNHRVIGQLYGGAAACSGSVNNGQPDWYGRFNVSWGAGLDEYLDPTGGNITVMDGYPDGAITFNNDAGVNITAAPEGLLCGAEQVEIEVTLTNTGANTLTSCMIEYTINGGAVQQQSWAGSLEQFETEVITLPPFTSQGGENEVVVSVTTPNGMSDENSLNNTTTVEFTAYDGPTANYTLTLILDDWGSETTWTLKRLGQVLYQGGPYQDNMDGTEIVESFCLEEGCYQFRIEDSYEDGICCEYGNGSWTITNPDGEVEDTGGEFGASEQTQFCVDIASHAPELTLSSMDLFPNPTSGAISVRMPSSSGTLSVLDGTGRTVHTQTTSSTLLRLNTEAWAEGNYVVEWVGPQGARAIGRMVVIR